MGTNQPTTGGLMPLLRISMLARVFSHAPSTSAVRACSSRRFSADAANLGANVCWMCGNRLDYSHALFCPSSHLQPPNDAASHFERLRCDVSFDLDPKQLHTTYKSLQKQLHPDRFACRPEELSLAHEHASLLNISYSTLKAPHKRAIYLLSLQSIDVCDESSTSIDDVELLSEIMDYRMELEDASTIEDIQRMLHQIQMRLEECINETSIAFKDGNMEQAARHSIRLQYVFKLSQELEQRSLV